MPWLSGPVPSEPGSGFGVGDSCPIEPVAGLRGRNATAGRHVVAVGRWSHFDNETLGRWAGLCLAKPVDKKRGINEQELKLVHLFASHC